jgi:hypothetical protein
MTLLTGMEAYHGGRNEEEWGDVVCPAIVRLVVNKQEVFAMALLGDVQTWDQTRLAFDQLQWVMGKKENEGGDGGSIGKELCDEGLKGTATHVNENWKEGRLDEMGQGIRRGDEGPPLDIEGNGYMSTCGQLSEGDLPSVVGAERVDKNPRRRRADTGGA